MKENKRYKGALTIRDIYKLYKTTVDKNKRVDYKTFSLIIKECNKEVVKAVVEESAIVRLPARLGLLKITKYERVFGDKQYKWALNYKASKEHGFKVYHDQPYIYAWRWNKKTSIIKNKSKYKFIACRKAKRAVPIALKTLKIDYYG